MKIEVVAQNGVELHGQKFLRKLVSHGPKCISRIKLISLKLCTKFEMSKLVKKLNKFKLGKEPIDSGNV